jgi:hypothetical protein
MSKGAIALVVVLLIGCVGLLMAGMSPAYGDKMLEGKLLLRGIPQQEVNNILKLPRLQNLDCVTGNFKQDGPHLWHNPEMTVAWIHEVEGQCATPVKKLFGETGEK